MVALDHSWTTIHPEQRRLCFYHPIWPHWVPSFIRRSFRISKVIAITIQQVYTKITHKHQILQLKVLPNWLRSLSPRSSASNSRQYTSIVHHLLIISKFNLFAHIHTSIFTRFQSNPLRLSKKTQNDLNTLWHNELGLFTAAPSKKGQHKATLTCSMISISLRFKQTGTFSYKM